MKRQKKRVWKRFSYRECDAMARYLEEMSEKGWYLKGLGFGMLFEQGIPTKTRYYVTVFLKGSTFDTRPEPETEEFAQYCESAGWKFVCNLGKVCVFSTSDPAAVEIDTEERERFQWIQKSESRERILCALFFAVMLAFCIREIYLEPEKLFDNRLWWNLLLVCLTAGIAGIELAEEKIWEWRSKKKLSLSEGLVYGRLPVCLRLLQWTPLFLCIAYMILTGIFYGYWISLFWFVLDLAILLMIAAVILQMRPSRGTNILFQAVGAVLIPIIVVSVITVAEFPEKKGAEEGKNPPLALSDLQEGGEETLVWEAYEGWLGNRTVCYQESEDAQETLLHYELTESPFDFILDLFWKQEIKEARREVIASEEDAKQWGAKEAARYATYGADILMLRYDEQLLIFQYEKEITPDRIRQTKDRLNITRENERMMRR